jgi:hypothetical protein
MMNIDMFKTMLELADDSNFKTCVPLSENQEDQAYPQELVLRFFMQDAFHGPDSQLRMELGEYLSAWMRQAAESEATGENFIDVKKFHRVFSLLATTLDDAAFRRWDPVRQRHSGPFSIASYEFVTSGLAAHLDWWEAHTAELADRVREGWGAEGFRNNSGAGVSPRRRLPKLVNAARAFFAPTE